MYENLKQLLLCQYHHTFSIVLVIFNRRSTGVLSDFCFNFLVVVDLIVVITI